MTRLKERMLLSDLGFWGEEGAGDSVQVLRVHLDADVVEAHLMEGQSACSGAEVALTSVRGDGDGVSHLAAWQVVTDGPVHAVLIREGRC